MQSSWARLAPPIDGFPRPRHPPIPTPMCGPGCAPTPPNTRAMGSGAPGRRYATTRASQINVKKVHRLWCEEGLQRRVHSPRKRPGRPRCPRWSPMPRRWCGRSTSSSIPPLTARRSRSRRWSTNTPVNRCCTGGTLHHRRATRRRAREGVRRSRRAADGAADGQRSRVRFSSAATVLRDKSACPTSRPVPVEQRLHRIIQQPTTGRSASTATTGTPCSRPAW